ncbi:MULTISPECIES: hypothetical protein [unclassified Blautia]|uniref:hypothetical protein n=1 Tax=unclassified Blautia TaxID=2648079 RepID=UPI000B36C7B9|nr:MULTISPECIES: hypothetical protein [unclassified Blautia]OUN30925.1 hypothetical protein B5G33_04980 [Blautia sp. An81]OUN93434.1 hypothetical protein B5G00_05725 [Blautia sp. An46]
MSKKEAIVDTCFFNKLSNNGKNIEAFKKVLVDLEYKPVVHPYIAEKELDVFPQFNKLIEEGFIRKAEYSEFIEDEDDAELYEQYFPELYEEMREYLEIKGSKKRIEKLAIPKGQTIYTYRRAGMSLGDVHMILMAFFMRLPIILSEDGDIEFLRSVAKRKISSNSYNLDIYNVVDLIMMIAQKEDTTFSKKELEKVVLEVKERARLSEVKQAWNETHSNA